MLANKYHNNWQKKKLVAARKHQIASYQSVNGLVIENRCGKIITLNNGESLIEFINCSYLGLDQDNRVLQAVSEGIVNYGVNFCASRTRALFDETILLETKLNAIFCQGSSTVFKSVHSAHTSILPLLGSGELPNYPLSKNGPTFILDKVVHASVQINRGLMDQFGPVVLTDFNDLSSVEQSCQLAVQNHTTPILISDSICSMGGAYETKDLLMIAEKFTGYVYLDDAHGTSITGINGCGYALATNAEKFNPRLIITPSLSKGFGVDGGAAVFYHAEDSQMLKKFSSAYVFSVPPAVPVIKGCLASANIHLSDEITILQSKLQENINYFDAQFCDHHELIVNYRKNYPIRAIYIGDEMHAIKVATELHTRGFSVTTAMYPTVAKGKSILRLAISAAHTQDQIKSLCKNVLMLISEIC